MSLQKVTDNWFWFFLFGAALVLLGLVAIGSAFAVTMTAMVFYGVLLLFGSGAQLVHAFYHRDWAGFLWGIVLAALYFFTGMILLNHPLLGAEVFTLLLGLSIAFNGAGRIALSLQHRRLTGWVAMLLGGLVSLLLGVFIVANWPDSSLFVIGLFIGVDLISSGISWMALALTARQSRGHTDGGAPAAV